jgi:hypothetical protein
LACSENLRTSRLTRGLWRFSWRTCLPSPRADGFLNLIQRVQRIGYRKGARSAVRFPNTATPARCSATRRTRLLSAARARGQRRAPSPQLLKNGVAFRAPSSRRAASNAPSSAPRARRVPRCTCCTDARSAGVSKTTGLCRLEPAPRYRSRCRASRNGTGCGGRSARLCARLRTYPYLEVPRFSASHLTTNFDLISIRCKVWIQRE